jgi:hypothetical protein
LAVGGRKFNLTGKNVEDGYIFISQDIGSREKYRERRWLNLD